MKFIIYVPETEINYPVYVGLIPKGIYSMDGLYTHPSENHTSLAFWLGQDAEGIKLMKITQTYFVCSDETGVTVGKVEIGQDENCPTNWYWRDGAFDYVLTPSPWNGPFYSKRAAYAAACLEKEPHYMVSN